MKQRTKSILIYLAGVISGIFLLFIVGLISNSANRSGGDITMYSNPQERLSEKKFTVIQVNSDGSAIAVADYGTKAVLFQAKGNGSYYDDQVITIPQGKVFRQIGTFRYENTEHMIKTIPVVDIFDK